MEAHLQSSLHLFSEDIIEILLLKFDERIQEEFEQYFAYHKICEGYYQDVQYIILSQDVKQHQLHGNLVSSDLLLRRILFIKFLEQKLKILNSIDMRKIRFGNFSKPWICQFCKQEGHFTETGKYTKDMKLCSAFLSATPAKRYFFIKREKICAYCLNPDYHIGDCLNKIKCSGCNKEHHHLICNLFQKI